MIIKKFHEHLVCSDDIIKKAIIKLQKLKIKICLVVDRNKKYIGTLTHAKTLIMYSHSQQD